MVKSWVVSVLGDDGRVLSQVDEGDRAVALETAQRASDPRDNVAVRGLKGATRVVEFPADRVVARFVMGERL